MEGIVEFKDWLNIELRVALVERVEEIEGADKLYKISLDVGPEIGERVVCAGLKPYYKKEDLEGKKVVLFVNLSPRKMKGIESQGMILAAVNESEEGKKDNVVLISPEKDIEVGSRIR